MRAGRARPSCRNHLHASRVAGASLPPGLGPQVLGRQWREAALLFTYRWPFRFSSFQGHRPLARRSDLVPALQVCRETGSITEVPGHKQRNDAEQLWIHELGVHSTSSDNRLCSFWSSYLLLTTNWASSAGSPRSVFRPFDAAFAHRGPGAAAQRARASVADRCPDAGDGPAVLPPDERLGGRAAARLRCVRGGRRRRADRARHLQGAESPGRRGLSNDVGAEALGPIAANKL